MKIGITGRSGFIGSHLFNNLSLFAEDFQIVDFERDAFLDEVSLDRAVRKCDIIIHLAALNRHKDPSIIYETNIDLVSKLVSSLKRTGCTPHVILASSSQEDGETAYGRSKKIGRELIRRWAHEKKATFTGLIVPNVFGPFGKPKYNSVVATFCSQLVNNECPEIHNNVELDLIYVEELIGIIISCIKKKTNCFKYRVKPTEQIRVSDLLNLLTSFKVVYQEKGEIPVLNTPFKVALFNTYRSFLSIKNIFPRKYISHNDDRGSFVELIRLKSGGQVSFSTTEPGVVRGNHFHRRKVERFSVVKGKALIQLRKVNESEIVEFYLDGNEPSYVDIPIWFTHNIRNIGEDKLYTHFWINEPYDAEDSDTFFEEV
ncbi:NAD-dependent epimerase/dehydratase family protein [bacterium]|nr:NAD-dependent epimerase/dehydratase family protein [bacterium]